MVTKIDSPLGRLSYLKTVELELELRGKHHERLLTGSQELYGRVVVSVLDDLIQDQSAYDLTFAEVYYYFMLVKIQSIGETMKAKWTCKNKLTRKGVTVTCNSENDYSFNSSDQIVNVVPKDHADPYWKGNIGYGEDEYTVKPTKIMVEFEILESLLEEGYKYTELLTNREMMYKFASLRMSAGLFSREGSLDGGIENYRSRFEKIRENFKYTDLSEMLKYQTKLEKFGYDRSPVTVLCKDCGGSVNFHLPLQAGLFV